MAVRIEESAVTTWGVETVCAREAPEEEEEEEKGCFNSLKLFLNRLGNCVLDSLITICQ
jgi:hypothetical protein